MKTLWCVLALLSLHFLQASGTSAGVEVKVTQKGLEYGREIGLAVLEKQLKTINIPDVSGSEEIFLIGDVSYSLTGMQIRNLGLPGFVAGFVPNTGVSLSISGAFLNIEGNWRVHYLIVDDSGSFDLNVNGIGIGVTIVIMRDETGRPTVSGTGCSATIGDVGIEFHGGASWLYNLFDSYIADELRSSLQPQICLLVNEAIAKMNPYLKTLNVLAQVDPYAEIEYSMVDSPIVSASSIDFGLKGEFYNIGHHVEPPFSPTPFSLPPQDSNMLYIGFSAFTPNSAGFVYNNAGVLSLYITDDMIPPSSTIRLNTKTFGVFIPQIAKQYPDLMMKLLVKAAKDPSLTFEPSNTTFQACSTVTAYAIQPNATLTPLFVLNVDANMSAQIHTTGQTVVGNLTLDGIDMTLGTSYVGPFEVQPLENTFTMIVKAAVLPKVNAYLAQGYPLPAIGQMHLINTQLQIMKGYILIGTDVQFY